MKNLNIGFLSYWGIGRGLSYVTLAYCKMLQDSHNLFILKQGKNKIGKEYESVNVNITETSEYDVDESVFRAWLKENKLDVVIFNEYDQWTTSPIDLVKLCKDYGVKTLGYLVAERLDHDQLKRYDRIIAPTISYARMLRRMRFRRFNYVPVSIDLEEFPKNTYQKNDKFTFYHPAGCGGVCNRKNTQAVLDAFKTLDSDKYKLIISTQKKLTLDGIDKLPSNIEIIEGDLSRKKLVNLYYKADAVVLPSRWETVGIPILESLSAGVPVITTSAQPMNEFITDRITGYLVKAKPCKVEGIKCYSMEVDVVDLARKMETISNEMMIDILKINSRKKAERDFNLIQNKKFFEYILDFVFTERSRQNAN